MKLRTVSVGVGCSIEDRDGISVEMNPFAHFLIGRPNKERAMRRIPLGVQFAKSIEQEIPCPMENEDAELGVCKACGVAIKEENRKKVTFMRENLEVWRWTASHRAVKAIEPVERGSFILTKEKNTLLLVEERPNDQDGRSALLIHAEEGYQGHSEIAFEPVDDNPVLDEIHRVAVGQRWTSSAGALGKSVERLLIVKPGDTITVVRTGKLQGQPNKLVIEVQQDLTLKTVATEKTAPPTPKNAIEI